MNDQLVEQLKRHEGMELKPYRCSEGKLTIGFGRNLDDRGISVGEANFMLRNDISQAYIDLLQNHPWVDQLDAARRDVFINMVFNLGINRFNGFRKAIAAAKVGDFELCAKEMLDSRWSIQVGQRADDLARQMVSGEYA